MQDISFAFHAFSISVVHHIFFKVKAVLGNCLISVTYGRLAWGSCGKTLVEWCTPSEKVLVTAQWNPNPYQPFTERPIILIISEENLLLQTSSC